MTFLILLVPVFIGFTYMVFNAYGPYLKSYSSFQSAMISVLFVTLGQIESDEMFKVNSVVLTIWVYLFFCFLYFIFMAIFMAIFVDSFELTVQKAGYPSDFKEDAQWRYLDYFYWLIAWMPNFIIKRIKGTNEADADDGDSDRDKKGSDDEGK